MCVLRELERRAAQRRCQVVVRVLCNRQVVCRSRPLSLYPHFTTCLNQLFCLQISDWPQSLTLELLVEGGLGPGKRLSASIFVPVPNRFKLYSDFFYKHAIHKKYALFETVQFYFVCKYECTDFTWTKLERFYFSGAIWKILSSSTQN